MSQKKKPNTLDRYEPLILEGVITDICVITLKHGKPMAFVLLDCEIGPAELVFFPEVYRANVKVLLEGMWIRVKAVRDCNDEGEVKYLVDDVVALQQKAPIDTVT